MPFEIAPSEASMSGSFLGGNNESLKKVWEKNKVLIVAVIVVLLVMLLLFRQATRDVTGTNNPVTRWGNRMGLPNWSNKLQ